MSAGDSFIVCCNKLNISGCEHPENSISFSIKLKVERREPELITPSEPTPYELKYLSDIDDQKFLRFQIPAVQFYRRSEGMNTEDPVKIIRQAVAKTLVHYYPFAGRVREGPNGKLMVECTGEGILFIEANANVSLHQFADVLLPPIPAMDELLYDVPGSSGIVNCPLLLIQVTRLTCGGFIFAVRLNHTMADASGLVQLLKAISEIARGIPEPSVVPVWNRELLMARNPPRVTSVHNGYEKVPGTNIMEKGKQDMVHGSFFFGPTETSTLRKHVPSHLRNCSTFDIVSACLWRTRTLALGTYNYNDEVRMAIPVNVRNKLCRPLPVGYYGNAVSSSSAVTSAGELCEKPLWYALELIKKAKADVTDEHVRSLMDFLVLKGRPTRKFLGTYGVSDVRRVGIGEIDFGWGKPVYGGPSQVDLGGIYGFSSFFLPMRNSEGDNGLVATLSLPKPAEEKFVMELEKLTRDSHAPKGIWTATVPGFRGGKMYNTKRNFKTAAQLFKLLGKKH